MKNKTQSILLFATLMFSPYLFSQDQIGIFENHQDVGEVAIPGSVAFNAEDQEYLIESSGENMWFGSDQFHYLWRWRSHHKY